MESLFVGLLIGLLIYVVLQLSGKGKEAIKDISTKNALSRNPNDIDALITMGFKNLLINNNLSIDYFQKALSFSPQNYFATAGIAIAYHEQKEYEKSSVLLKSLITERFNELDTKSKHYELFYMLVLRYCYGHVCKMEGNNIDAEKSKMTVTAFSELEKNMITYIDNRNWY